MPPIVNVKLNCTACNALLTVPSNLRRGTCPTCKVSQRFDHPIESSTSKIEDEEVEPVSVSPEEKPYKRSVLHSPVTWSVIALMCMLLNLALTIYSVFN